MSTLPCPRRPREIDYPTSDGKPMAETDLHRNEMTDVIHQLEDFYADRPQVYVSGNILLYYEEGNPRRHVSPDALVALDVPKRPPRLYYQVWKEGKAPELVMEITSKTTRREDLKTKFAIYRDILRVSEYILFDPKSEYLIPSLQGFRLMGGDYAPIELEDGRLPSQVLGLHLERSGTSLRFYDPALGVRLPTRLERQRLAERSAERAQRLAEDAERHAASIQRTVEEVRLLAEEANRRARDAETELRRVAEENERLRREIEALRAKG